MSPKPLIYSASLALLCWSAPSASKDLQAEFDAFIKTCAYPSSFRNTLGVPNPPAISGVSYEGSAPVAFEADSSGEGARWGFVFDMTPARFRAKHPELAHKVEMKVSRKEGETDIGEKFRALNEDWEPKAYLYCKTVPMFQVSGR